jgi:hypothetical protein
MGDSLFKRSVLMPEHRALSFSRCLDANPFIEPGSVAVRRSLTATHEERFFVVWRPANPHRLSEMDAKFATDRRERAAAERADMAFYAATDAPGWYWCVRDRGGDDDATVYLVHPAMGCHPASGCKDMNVRCRPIGAVCKHTYALAAHLEGDSR